jgi:hypothetical protein
MTSQTSGTDTAQNHIDANSGKGGSSAPGATTEVGYPAGDVNGNQYISDGGSPSNNPQAVANQGKS